MLDGLIKQLQNEATSMSKILGAVHFCDIIAFPIRYFSSLLSLFEHR